MRVGRASQGEEVVRSINRRESQEFDGSRRARRTLEAILDVLARRLRR